MKTYSMMMMTTPTSLFGKSALDPTPSHTLHPQSYGTQKC